MKKALLLAERGLGTVNPNPMVGAVIVRNGRIIGEGYHIKAGEAHAEVNAINSVKKQDDLVGASLYVTLEPCSTWGRTPPCTEAIIRSGIKHVYIGCLDPNPKHAGASIPILKKHGIDSVYGILEDKCALLNEAFFKWITVKKPFVLLKLAETLDGKIATASGSSQWITGAKARARVHKLRMWADLVMAGAGTYRKDSPQFTARDKNGNVLKTPRRVIATRKSEVVPPEGWETVCLSDKAAWDEYLLKLGSENVTSVLIEGGGEFAASALAAQAVDRVEFHIAPKILGGRGSRPSVAGDNPLEIAQAFDLSDIEVFRMGNDIGVSGLLKYGKKRTEA